MRGLKGEGRRGIALLAAAMAVWSCRAPSAASPQASLPSASAQAPAPVPASVPAPVPAPFHGGIEVWWHDQPLGGWLGSTIPKEEEWLVIDGQRWDPEHNVVSATSSPVADVRVLLASGGWSRSEGVTLDLRRGATMFDGSAAVVDWSSSSCTMRPRGIECTGGRLRLGLDEAERVLYVNAYLVARFPWGGRTTWRTFEGTFHVPVPEELLPEVRPPSADDR